MSSGSRRRTGKSRDSSSEGMSPINFFLSEASASSRDKHRNNFLKFLQSITGVEVDVNLNDGRIYRGVFYTATPFEGKRQEVALKAARKMDKFGRVIPDGNIEIGSTVLLSFTDILTLTVSKSKISANQASSDLATDANISRRANLAELDGRDLESVGSVWLAPETSTKIDRMSTHVQGSWNQFEANKRLYNVQDTFDENLYTKRLDKSLLTREQQEKADRIANQIEKSSTSNIHLKEERGQLGDSLEIDEEDMYSGVIRSEQSVSSNGGIGKGSKGGAGASAAPAGAWRKMDVSGMVSPSSGSKSKGFSPSSGKQSKATPESTSTPPPAPVRFESPALPPGFGHDDASTNSPSHTPVESTVAPVEDKPEVASLSDNVGTADDAKKDETDQAEVIPSNAASATPSTSKSFSFNVAATEFVPSFAKSPPATITPSITPANTANSPHEGAVGGRGHHGRGGRGGRGRGGRQQYGNNYSNQSYDRNFQGNVHMAFGQPMMPVQMGYDMNMFPGMNPYGIPPGAMPVGFDGGYGGGGFYPPQPPGGYFIPPHFDPSFGGMPGGMMPGPPMGMYDQQQQGMTNIYPGGAPGGDMGGVPVAAGLGNISHQQQQMMGPSGETGSTDSM